MSERLVKDLNKSIDILRRNELASRLLFINHYDEFVFNKDKIVSLNQESKVKLEIEKLLEEYASEDYDVISSGITLNSKLFAKNENYDCLMRIIGCSDELYGMYDERYGDIVDEDLGKIISRFIRLKNLTCTVQHQALEQVMIFMKNTKDKEYIHESNNLADACEKFNKYRIKDCEKKSKILVGSGGEHKVRENNVDAVVLNKVQNLYLSQMKIGDRVFITRYFKDCDGDMYGNIISVIMSVDGQNEVYLTVTGRVKKILDDYFVKGVLIGKTFVYRGKNYEVKYPYHKFALER